MRFELTTDEIKEIAAWDKQHLNDHHDGEEPYAGAIGGRLSFVITSTSMGMLLGVQCNACARTKPHEVYYKNLTDFSDW